MKPSVVALQKVRFEPRSRAGSCWTFQPQDPVTFVMILYFGLIGWNRPDPYLWPPVGGLPVISWLPAVQELSFHLHLNDR